MKLHAVEAKEFLWNKVMASQKLNELTFRSIKKQKLIFSLEIIEIKGGMHRGLRAFLS